MSIWGPTLQTNANLLLSAGRETEGQVEERGEKTGLSGPEREASRASWSGFEVNRWAEWHKGSRREAECCRRSGRETQRKWRVSPWRENKVPGGNQQVVRRRLCRTIAQVRHTMTTLISACVNSTFLADSLCGNFFFVAKVQICSHHTFFFLSPTLLCVLMCVCVRVEGCGVVMLGAIWF